MKAKKWNFSNCYVYQPGINEWLKKHPRLTIFKGEPLAEHLQELTKLEADYQKHLLSTKEFLRRSRLKNHIVFDVRSLDLRDNFPIDLPHLKHYPVDRLVKLIESGSRKVTRNPLLIIDNCGKQTFWLEYVLQQAGLNHYNFLKKGVLSWKQQGYDHYGHKRKQAVSP